MKVCHLTSSHPPTDTRIFIKECDTLSKSGYEVHYVVPGIKDEVRNNISLHGVVKAGKNRLLRMLEAIIGVYKKALEVDADLYHFHDPILLPVGLLLRKKGKKVIYDVHENVPGQIYSKKYIPFFLRPLVSFAFKLLENYAAKRLSAIVTCHPAVVERFSALNKQTTNVDNFPILSELYTDNTDWGEKEPVVCFVGAIADTRGIFEMVRAIGLTKYRLLLGG